MSSVFNSNVLKIVVAQICQNIGWHAINSVPLELLVDILHRYLSEVTKTVHRYSEQFGRTQPIPEDVGLAFRDIGIQLTEVEEYINNVEPVPFVHDVPRFPLPQAKNLQFPVLDIKDLHQKPDWLEDHMPIVQQNTDDELDTSMEKKENGTADASSPLSSPRAGSKRPIDSTSSPDTGNQAKRARYSPEVEVAKERTTREFFSLYMSPDGSIRHVKGDVGRLPESRLPVNFYDDTARPSSPLSIQKLKAHQDKVKKYDKKKKDKLKIKKGNKENEKKKKKLKLKKKLALPKDHDNLDTLIAAMEQGIANEGLLPAVGGSYKSKKPKNISIKKLNSPKKKSGQAKSPKKPKSPTKTTPKPKPPKPEKQVPGGQMDYLMSKVIANSMERENSSKVPTLSIAAVKASATAQSSDFAEPSSSLREDSPDSLIIDLSDKAEFDESIDAVVKRGVEVSSNDRSKKTEASVESAVKAGKKSGKSEAKDIYEFTDEDFSAAATTAVNFAKMKSPGGMSSPPSSSSSKKDKDKKKHSGKSKDKAKSKNKKSTNRSPRSEPLDLTEKKRKIMDIYSDDDDDLPSQRAPQFPLPPQAEPANNDLIFQNLPPALFPYGSSFSMAQTSSPSVYSTPSRSFSERSPELKSTKSKDRSGSEKKGKLKSKESKKKDKLKNKKKKDKMKAKDKSKSKKDKGQKKDKDKKREKKEDKEKISEISSVPKLTLKLGSAPAPEVPKLIIKPMGKAESPVPPKRDLTPIPPRIPTPQPAASTPKVGRPSKLPTKKSGGSSKKTSATMSSSCTVVTETVGSIIDENGVKIWICPACTGVDDGSPMIGCDGCDDWYHLVCVGMTLEESERAKTWYCGRCKQSPKKLKSKKK